MAGMTTGEHHRVPGPGFRGGVTVLGVGENRAAIEQPPQSAGIEGLEPGEVIKSHLIDRQHQHEPWLASRRLTEGWRTREGDGEESEPGRGVFHPMYLDWPM